MTNSGSVELESGFPYETVRALMVMGPDGRFTLGQYGGYQGIAWDAKNHTYIGASEGRKDGQAAGY
jgi:gamma-glutamyltranspeptidase/glutathione hydrolase